MSGGLTRRAHKLETIRQEGQPVLLLDNGNLFNRDEDYDVLMLRALDLMKYDALDIGATELQFGSQFFERFNAENADHAVPFIASNLLFQGARPSWAHDYIIKTEGDLKVAILGIIDPDILKVNSNQERGWGVIPPEDALEKLLPEVRKKADLVILMAQLEVKKLYSLLDDVKGVDVCISSLIMEKRPKKADAGCGCGGTPSRGMDKISKAMEGLKPPQGTTIVNPEYKGGKLGLLKIKLDGTTTSLDIIDDKTLFMKTLAPQDEKMMDLLRTFHMEQKEKEAQFMQKLTDNLQLTPEEFMEQYKQEQTDIEKGGVR